MIKTNLYNIFLINIFQPVLCGDDAKNIIFVMSICIISYILVITVFYFGLRIVASASALLYLQISFSTPSSLIESLSLSCDINYLLSLGSLLIIINLLTSHYGLSNKACNLKLLIINRLFTSTQIRICL